MSSYDRPAGSIQAHKERQFLRSLDPFKGPEGTWRCEATGLVWTGQISNHHGLEPGEGFCPGPHLPAGGDSTDEKGA